MKSLRSSSGHCVPAAERVADVIADVIAVAVVPGQLRGSQPGHLPALARCCYLGSCRGASSWSSSTGTPSSRMVWSLPWQQRQNRCTCRTSLGNVPRLNDFNMHAKHLMLDLSQCA